MKIYKVPDRIPEKTAVAIGMFDGVHRGHQLLVKRMLVLAEKKNLLPFVYTFSSHPLKETKRKYLTLLEEKLFLLEQFGIKNVFIAELNENFMRMTPEEFFGREIVSRMNARAIVVGENFRFGRGRRGNVETLKTLGKKSGILVKAVPLLKVGGVTVSSSLIHSLVEKGEMEKANSLLGYEFFVSGKVVRGKGIGRLLGFPTANVAYKNGYKVLPKKGVYITYAELSGQKFGSVTNVGTNPTFERDGRIKIETHFLDTAGDLYGKEIRLRFLKFLRNEKKFSSVSELIEQIKTDTETARAYFGG